jgi:RNA polymerase sigma factor (sigma-70 family)
MTPDNREERLRLHQALRDLDAEERAIFLLRHDNELTYEVIAVIRQSTMSRVKTRMRSALQKLRKILN